MEGKGGLVCSNDADIPGVDVWYWNHGLAEGGICAVQER